MGFRVIPKQEDESITIESLTPEMVGDLITCFAYDVPAENVEARLPATIGFEVNGDIITIPMKDSEGNNYPIISKEVVQAFYDQAEILAHVIKDVIIGNYHTGNVVGSTDGTWVWGPIPTSINQVKQWTFFVIKRDFNEQGTWLYDMSQGDFESLRPFIYQGVDLFFLANDHGDFNVVAKKIRTEFPFVQE